MRWALRSSWLSLLAFGALVLAGCYQSESIPPLPMSIVREVLVFPAELTLTAGSSKQLSAQLNDSTGEPVGGARVSYRTDHPRLLEVSSRGRVRSRGPAGSGVVVVGSGVAEARVAITVFPARPARLRRLGGPDATAAQPPLPTSTLAVQVADSYGNPVSKVDVVFRLRGQTRDRGSQILRTDAQGIATLSSLGEAAKAVDVDVQVLEVPKVRTSYRMVPAAPVLPADAASTVLPAS